MPRKPFRFLSRHSALLLGTLVLSCPPLSAEEDLRPPETLISWDATWRFHDGNEDLGDDWKEPGFDSANWKEGRGLLGYARGGNTGNWPQPGLQTKIAEGLGTYYLRKEFTFSGSPEGMRLKLDHVIDDAAVYYLNGREIGRSRLVPEGPAGFATRSTSATNPVLESNVFDIDDNALREGRNVLAVSLHNHNTNSSDIAFAAHLIAEDVRTPIAPVGLHLTWQSDPTTTMTIDWQRRATESDQAARIEARPKGRRDWTSFEAKRFDFPHSDRKIDRVELTNLQPGTEYEFRGGPGSRVYYFRTMPAKLEKPLVFAVGGDTRHNQGWLEEMNRAAMKHGPEFIVWGGDLAYEDGLPANIGRWYEWFDGNMNALVAEDGRIPPIIVGIGNHEVQGGSHQNRMTSDAARARFAPFFFGLFAFPGQPGYGVLDFGNYLSLVIGDTEHANPIPGKQTDWMAKTLAEREKVTHLIPVYHVPAFPSNRSYDGSVSKLVREHWLPLFERHGVQLAFEHHDHTYKRTKPIRNGKVSDDGIIYMGDGAWGVGERPVHDPATTWYLEKSRSIRHGMIVTLTPDRKKVTAVSHRGEVFDEVEIPVR